MTKTNKQQKTIVLKIGTESITRPDGEIDNNVLCALVDQAVALREAGHKVVIVSSGAVKAGRGALPVPPEAKLKDVEKAVAAGVGQLTLMLEYRQALARHGYHALQGLSENVHFQNGMNEQRWNLQEALSYCFDFCPKIIPILNENDLMSRVELRELREGDPAFSDNDGLAALIGNLIGADAIIAVSANSLYTADPRSHADARHIPFVNFGSAVTGLAAQGVDTTGKTDNGSGGMETKIDMAKTFLCAGEALCGQRLVHVISVAELLTGGILKAVVGKPVGTEFCCYRSQAQKSRLAATPFACACG
ncbi:MAG: hypothetical protein PHW63_03255 [Alphaproteobacteria bacterium]|nr:hypothetical protein [Alphaproteobacteria bacterium]